ncbi:probable disease resistance protein At4g27220 [Coffea arabica]|uniref:Probable disease resistance protein At4g27220 n=1 Tax=Coffea arabica TaxID=13443 RepID=A0ABM4X741_COFAR
MDAIITIFARIGYYLTTPVGNRLSYLYDYRKIVKNLQEQVEELNDVRMDVEQSINEAKRNGKVIKVTVSKWSEAVESTIAETDSLIHKVNLDKRCLRGCFPDWIARYQLSKEAIEKTAIVMELQELQPREDIYITLPPLNIEILPEHLTPAENWAELVTLGASTSTTNEKSRAEDVISGASTSTLNQKSRSEDVNFGASTSILIEVSGAGDVTSGASTSTLKQKSRAEGVTSIASTSVMNEKSRAKDATSGASASVTSVKRKAEAVTFGASKPTVNENVVLQKKTVSEIIGQRRGLVNQIISHQREAVDQIFDALQDDNCAIIGMYGMGGMGKTTLAKEIGRMAETSGLFNKVIFAVVSRNIDVRKIQGRIGDMLGLYFQEESEMGRAGRLFERLTTQERILLILDDVWNFVNFKEIGIPVNFEGKGCKILITTRQRNLCSMTRFVRPKIPHHYRYCEKSANGDQFHNRSKRFIIINALNLAIAKNDQSGLVPFDSTIRMVLDAINPFTTNGLLARSTMGLRKTMEIPLRLLSDDESWNLFKTNAGSLADTFSPQQDDVAMKVARECCGLPLALVTVGRALRNKDLELWKAALQQLKKSKPLNINCNEEKNIFSCLKLSYDQLQSEDAKECFLLCCLFPEDHDIKIEDIASYGLGKGMFTDVDTMEEARRETRWIIRNLTDCCLLLDSSTEDSVRMHDMVRDFAISIASTREHGFVIKAGLGLKEWPNQETLERNAVIISLMTNHIQSLPERLICPKLEILLLGENEVFEIIPEGFFLGMPTLRVLDLSEKIGARSLNHYFEPDKWTSMLSSSFKLPSSFEALVNLRTLHLNHCKLDDVAVLGKLKRLEVLSFYGCDIEELPKEIGELVNLRLLDLNFCQKLKTVPATLLSRLCQLEELYMWESFHQWAIQGMVEDTSKACLSEITSLSHLTTLCIQVSNPESVPRKLHIPNVQKFEIVIGKGYDSVTCYPNSRSLSLREIKTSIPEGVKDILQNTEDLRLFCLYDEMIRNILDVDLRTLNNLRYLKVVACMETSFLLSMNQSASDAPAILAALESLHLQLMNELFVICPKLLPVGSLHKLKFLKLQSCKRMWVAITATLLQRLLSLEEVEATWCKQMSSVFDLGNISSENQQFLLSNLRIIRLHGLESLRTIWKGGVKPLPPSVRLVKLTVVELSSCGSLKVIFPYSIAQNLLQLEVLKINWCNKLERIVEKRPEDY